MCSCARVERVGTEQRMLRKHANSARGAVASGHDHQAMLGRQPAELIGGATRRLGDAVGRGSVFGRASELCQPGRGSRTGVQPSLRARQRRPTFGFEDALEAPPVPQWPGVSAVTSERCPPLVVTGSPAGRRPPSAPMAERRPRGPVDRCASTCARWSRGEYEPGTKHRRDSLGYRRHRAKRRSATRRKVHRGERWCRRFARPDTGGTGPLGSAAGGPPLGSPGTAAGPNRVLRGAAGDNSPGAKHRRSASPRRRCAPPAPDVTRRPASRAGPRVETHRPDLWRGPARLASRRPARRVPRRLAGGGD